MKVKLKYKVVGSTEDKISPVVFIPGIYEATVCRKGYGYILENSLGTVYVCVFEVDILEE
jgi:hypothetical protein